MMNASQPENKMTQPTDRRAFGRKMLSQRGYSIIELSIALAILAVIIIGGLLGVQTILRNNRTNEMLKNTPVYIANAAKITSSQPTITSTTFALADLGVFPASYVSGNAGARLVNHEHGGRIFLERNTVVSGATPALQTFVLTLSAIPQAACVDLASGLVGLTERLAVVQSTGAARTVLPGGNAVVKDVGGALDLVRLATACTVAGQKEIVAVIGR